MIGTLTDTGPLYSLIDRGADEHDRAQQGAKAIVLPMVTTWPCVTEAFYFLGERIGWARGQAILFEMIEKGDVVIIDPENHSPESMTPLMEKYRDTPMDLADASLVAAAINLKKSDIFAFDDHFHVYRLDRRRGFNVIS